MPADEDTELDGSKLTVTGTGTATTISYTEDDGTVTTYTPAAAPTATADTLFRPAGIAEPGVASKTTYSYDGSGRVARILAPAPPGVTCPATGDLNPGCRALRFDYGTSGDATGRLTGAWLDIYNPAKTGGAGMDSVKVADYTYGPGGRLTKVTDPRSGLSTEYGYNTFNHLTSIKPAGQTPFQLVYVPAGDTEMLSEVRRDRPAGDPAGGTAQLAKFVYDVPLSGAGLPDLSAASVLRWDQKTSPTSGYAVFGPDRPLTGAPGEADWAYADLQYTDANGYTINTASYGAGDWQYTATGYNEQGNVIRELDERALRLVVDNQMPSGAGVDQLATVTEYNADIKNAAGDTVLTPAGTLVTDAYGPARYAALKDGTIAWVRTHTHTDYDQGAPNAGINPDTALPYRLATTETTSAHDAGANTDIETISRSLTDYSAPVSGDADGWALGQAGKTITDANPSGPRDEVTGDVVRLTRYDTEGRLVETRQPESNGADADTTKTVHYTAAANAAFPDCGGKPQWAGLTCKTYPAAQPTSSTGDTPALPTTTTTGYTYLLAPITVVEASGAVTRTTVTERLQDGRVSLTRTTVVGLANSAANTEKEWTYSPTTGLEVLITAEAADGTSQTISTGYDDWGRRISYQPSGQAATTATYDSTGRVSNVSDPNGATAYHYDGIDAMGRPERRGLPTSVTVNAGSTTWTSSGAYDANASLTMQRLPGGIIQTSAFDNAGELVESRYLGQITTTNEDGSTSVDPNGGWLSWSIDNDVTGRVAREWTPDGAAFTGPEGDTPGDAIPYDRAYSYDAAGRLIQVHDRTAGATGVDITDPTASPCITRAYGFDRNSNRLTKATATSGADGACTAAGATSSTRAFDTADRPVTGVNGVGVYAYDALGRTTLLPSSDAPRPTDGYLTIGYYDNNAVQTIEQAERKTTMVLDAVDRRSIEITESSNGVAEVAKFYADSSDNPTWVTQGGTTQRFAQMLSSQLSVIIDTSGPAAGAANVVIANPHGDVVTESHVTTDAPATAIGDWRSFDEYGQPLDDVLPTPGQHVDVGWLGVWQRPVAIGGMILMGARLYNPATGLFTSPDPMIGGNVTDLSSPVDPVNHYDVSGEAQIVKGPWYVAYDISWISTWETTFRAWYSGYRVQVRLKIRVTISYRRWYLRWWGTVYAIEYVRWVREWFQLRQCHLWICYTDPWEYTGSTRRTTVHYR